MKNRLLATVVLAVGVASCLGGTDFELRLSFPDGASFQRTAQLDVWALVPGPGASCAELVAGTAAPGDDGYEVERAVRVSSLTGTRHPVLTGVGPGPRLFHAVARDAADRVFLRGCTEARTGSEGAGTVTVELQRVDPPCTGDAGCSDGIFCNGEESCRDGYCEGGQRDCSDSDECTEDSCDERLDRCLFRPVVEAPESEGPVGDPSCEDERDNDCDGLTDGSDPACKVCDDDLDCDDLESCTSDSCSQATCVNQAVAEGTGCDDGEVCTEEDACRGGRCGGQLVDCGHLDAGCLVGVCHPTQGHCEALEVSDGTACDDSRYCTLDEACAAGVCAGGQSRDCGDGDECTEDSCDETGDSCTNVLQANPGGEGLGVAGSCTDHVDNDCDREVDEADPDCQPCQEDGDCDDGDPCTTHTCNGLHQCESAPALDGTSCDDDVRCTEDDVCDGGACVGVPLDCSHLDGPCLAGTCVEASGTCASEPVDEGESCEDGAYCTEGERCQSGACAGGTPTGCDDDSSCTEDRCLEAEDRCEHTPVAGPFPPEGPAGDASCADYADNDCNGLADGNDPVCGGLFCETDGLCWLNPRPLVFDLTAVWSPGSGEAWIGGDAGTVIQFEQGRWGNRVLTQYYVMDLWGTATDDLWAVGGYFTNDVFIEHWIGNTWFPEVVPAGVEQINGVYGVSSNRAWAVSESGHILIWDGTQWAVEQQFEFRRLRAVWAASWDYAWAIDGINVFRRWPINTWSQDTIGVPVSGSFMDIWGFSDQDIWVVGTAGTILHFNGSAWSSVPCPVSSDLFTVWGAAADDIWAAGDGVMLRWNGDSWNVAATDLPAINRLRGSAADDAWAVGDRGAVFHWDGVSWEQLSSGVSDVYPGAAWGTLHGDVWVVGYQGQIARFDGKGWEKVPSPVTGNLEAVWGASQQDIWAVGWDSMAHWDGTSWSQGPVEANTRLYDVWGASTDNVWVVGATDPDGDGYWSGVVRHWNGLTWTTEDMGVGLYGIHGTGPDDVWAVGEGNIVMHWDGANWNADYASTDHQGTLGEVWAAGDADVWAATYYHDGLFHWNGVAWVEVSCTDCYGIMGFAATAAGEKWAVGYLGDLLRFDGSTWNQVGINRNYSFRDILILGDVLWVFGHSSAVMIRDLGPVTAY